MILCICLIPLGWGLRCAAKISDRKGFFSYIRLERRDSGRTHPLRAIRELVDAALTGAFAGLRQALCARWPAVDPAGATVAGAAAAGVLHGALGTAVDGATRLQSAVPLVRRAVGDDPVWDATVFCKNRDRLLDGDIAAKFFAAVLNLPQVRKLLSSEHFSVDGTLIEAWASMKSFVPKEATAIRLLAKDLRLVAAMPSATSMAKNAAMTRIPRPPTPMPGCSAKVPARRPSSATWGI